MPESNGSLVSSVDRLVGDGVEAAVRAKHAWRLRRLGWEHALEPPDYGTWAMGDPPPRDGCSLDVLVDGAAAFPAIAEAISNAREHVHVTGWHVA
ncbi:MAG: phospholipase D-like domain-containing protein, partial [Solirubrobacteraceae bacterium]